MPFPEHIKLEAKRKSDFQCCICKEPFVEVHHITPQAAGGSDDIDNAAPLCASCHDRYGGNPDKRKQVREMRDLWWEVCAERKKAPELIAFNQRLDQIQSGIAQTHIQRLSSQRSRLPVGVAQLWIVRLLRAFMDKSEAQKILGEQLARFSSYTELVPLVEAERVENFEVRGASGTKYQVEVQFFWDDKRRRVVRVVGSIDDGGIRAFVPLTQTLLISPPESVTT
jgi:HNH endonuclease